MALHDKNLYAYCDNNPVVRVDEDGALWQIVLAGAAINVVTSYYAALATEQEYTWKDAFFAALSGGISSIFIPEIPLTRLAPVVGGLISGGYAYKQSLDNDTSEGEAVLCGIAAFAGTALTGGSLATMAKVELPFASSVAIGTSFSMGGNMTSAAVYKSVTQTENKKKSSITGTVIGSVMKTAITFLKKKVKKKPVRQNRYKKQRMYLY